MTQVSRNPTSSVRLVARQVSKLMGERVPRWRALVPQEGATGVVFEVVMSACIAHLPFRDPASGAWIGIDIAATQARPVTTMAIALSMKLPATSVRRRAGELVDAGLLIRDADGFRPSPAFLADEKFRQGLVEENTSLIQAIATLAATGYDPAIKAVAAGVSALPPGIAYRVFITFTLRVLETFTTLYGDVPSGAIVAAIVIANIRHVTEDPVLARLYAAEDMPPPDAVRRPIALRPLARMIEMPFETVRRRVNALIAEGVVEWRGDGVVVPTHVLLDERQLDNNRRNMMHFEQLLATLVALATDRSP